MFPMELDTFTGIALIIGLNGLGILCIVFIALWQNERQKLRFIRLANRQKEQSNGTDNTNKISEDKISTCEVGKVTNEKTAN